MLTERLNAILQAIENKRIPGAANAPVLVAVSKTRSPAEIAEAAAAGQRAFGENYVQEARTKIEALAGQGLEWHLVGHLQSNKAAQAAELFDWVQTVDRRKLVDALASHRAEDRPPLNVLVQVNIDDESSKHGCRPAEIAGLAAAIAAQPRLRLRGLMAIPAPHPQAGRRRTAFREMAALLKALRQSHPGVDTLSMGMSDDYIQAIEEGATMVRVGSALFGERAARADAGHD